MNSQLRRFADMAFCINLATRTDRWTFMKVQFEKHELEVHRFDAVDGRILPRHLVPESPPLKAPMGAGAYASLISHLSLIKLAQSLDMRAIMIWEDDVQIHPDFTRNVGQFLQEVPDDWDMIYLYGLVLLDRSLVHGSVMRASYIHNNCCYIVRNTVYQKCIDSLMTKGHWADQLLAGLHPQMRVYTPAAFPVQQLRTFGSDNKGIK